MNTKGKGESGRAIIGIVLVAIVLASVFAGISASAIAGDNETNESVVNDDVSVQSQVEGEGVVASAVGSITMNRSADSPTTNIANITQNYVEILRISCWAEGESINLTNITIDNEGDIDDRAITGISINVTSPPERRDQRNVSTGITFPVTLNVGTEIPLGTLKDFSIYVNTSAEYFEFGKSIKLNVTSYNATGLGSGRAADTKFGTPYPVSHTIYGAGRLNVSSGPSDVTEPNYANAGAWQGTVIMQMNVSAQYEKCREIKNVTVKYNSSAANAASVSDIETIYLVNDTDMDGVWDSDEPIITTPVGFDDDGTAVLEGIGTITARREIEKDSYINWLIVVNTTKSFWSNESIAVNITGINGEGYSSGKMMGAYVEDTVLSEDHPVASNVTTGRARIVVTAGPNQPYYERVNGSANKNLENVQLNFTAIGGAVKITSITLEQQITGTGWPNDWSNASNTTYPKIYLDEDGDGNVTSADTPLNISVNIGNFTADNATLANCTCNQTGQNETTFTDWAELANGTINVYYHNTSLYNSTSPWWINVSVRYINFTGQSNTTWLNFTNSTLEGREWQSCSANFSDGVKDITNVTYHNESGNNIINFTFDIVAASCVVKVSLLRNVSLVSKYIAYNKTGVATCINTSDATNITEIVTDGDTLIAGTTNIWWHNISLYNVTGVTSYFNISVSYINSSGLPNTTWLNYTNATFYGEEWINLSSNFTDGVRDITGMTMKTADAGDSSIYNMTGEIIAASQPLEIGSLTESDAGYESKYIIIAVNTTDEFVYTDTDNYNRTRALPTNTSLYGNWSNYVAYDLNVSTRIYNSNATAEANASKAKTINARGGLPDELEFKVTETGITQPGYNVSIGKNFIPVLGLNFTWSGTPTAERKCYLDSITISATGTANETGNITLNLAYDVDGNGVIDENDVILATEQSYSKDDEKIDIEFSPLEFKLLPPETPKTVYKNILVFVNVSEDAGFDISDPRSCTLQFKLANASIDYDAYYVAYTGAPERTLINETATIAGKELYSTGAIDAVLTAKTDTFTKEISSEVDSINVSIMQINFTASSTEDVNITNVTFTWNGTVNANTSVKTIALFNDSDFDGVYNSSDTVLNVTTGYPLFVDNVTQLSLDPPLRVNAGKTACMLVCVGTNSSNFEAGDQIAINISASPYVNYTAKGLSSNKTITDYSTTALSSATLTGHWSGNISVAPIVLNVTGQIVGKQAHTGVELLGLNFSASDEAMNISWIKVTANGTVHEANNITNIRLFKDVDKSGNYTTGDTEIPLDTTYNITAENGTANLTLSPELQIEGQNYTWILVVADTTDKLEVGAAGNMLNLSLNNPSTDYCARGAYSGIRVYDLRTTEIKNSTYITGNVTVDEGTNTTATGPVTAMNATFVPIMQLNFSATPALEDVNITGVRLEAGPDATDLYNDTWGVGVYNDTNGNGVIDDGEVELGNGTFNINGTAIINFHTNLTINGTASQEWANRTFNNTVVYVNTSNNFTFGHVLQVKLVSYNATGNTSRQTLTDFGVPIISNKLTGTGNITVVNGTKTPSPQYILAGANTTVPVWQLNLSTNHENATLNSITLTFNGTAAVTDISAVDLYYDANSNGTVEAANDTLIASGTISDSKVTLEPTETFYINTTVKSLLVTVNTTADFKDNDTIAFNITVNTTAPEMAAPDVNATGVNSSKVIATNYTVPLSSNTLTGYGSIDLYAGDVQSDTTNTTTNTNVSVMELNFSAPRGKINITNITVTWNGTADTNKLTNISIWQDDGDGNFSETSDTLINMTTFPTTGNITIETTAAGNPANLTVENETSNVYIVVKIGATKLTAGKTLGFDVNQTRGVGYNATCNETGRIPYSTENQTITGKISVTGAPVNQIELYTGWNLISLWLIPSNTSIEAVTSEIETNLDAVWYYDASVPKWESYSPDFEGAQDLTEMTAGWGYWVKMKANDTLPVSGNFLPSGNNTPPTYTVYEGWNLIGFHSENETAVNATTYLEGVSWKEPMYKWDALNKQYDLVKGSDNMEQGKGYWLAVTETEATIYPY